MRPYVVALTNSFSFNVDSILKNLINQFWKIPQCFVPYLYNFPLLVIRGYYKIQLHVNKARLVLEQLDWVYPHPIITRTRSDLLNFIENIQSVTKAIEFLTLLPLFVQEIERIYSDLIEELIKDEPIASTITTLQFGAERACSDIITWLYR